MKCPKCHYLSFDPEPRCKNCGFDLEGQDAPAATPRTPAAHDFSYEHNDRFVYEPDAPDLILREFSDERTIQLRDEPALAPSASTGRLEPEEPEEAEEPAPPAAPEPVARFRAPHTTTEMPLFVKGIADREPIVASSALLDEEPIVPESRPPLSVRRPAVAPRGLTRGRERKPGPIDQDLLEDLRRVEREEAAQTLADARAIAQAAGYGDRTLATSRLIAAVVDAALLGVIAAFVLWGTLRVSEVTLGAVGLGAWVPLTTFVLAVAAGYLVLFLASGGQTIGMMLAGIRVVADGPRGRVEDLTLAQAISRAGLVLVSVLPLGLGWLPAIFGNGLALHDRLSHTRVVRA
jgi:uncharacterized RDD family membrane protein YckC